MLFLKSDVRITGMRPEILLAAVAAMRVYETAGHDFMITACVDGKHMTGSLHYAGAAIDASAFAAEPWDARYAQWRAAVDLARQWKPDERA